MERREPQRAGGWALHLGDRNACAFHSLGTNQLRQLIPHLWDQTGKKFKILAQPNDTFDKTKTGFNGTGSTHTISCEALKKYRHVPS